jgi:hypothetical protein
MAQTKPRESQVREAAPPGEWLFRHSELTLGPVSGAVLVDKLYNGELSGRTPISPLGQDEWRAMKDVSAFQLHLAKAEAKLRVDAAAKRQAADASKSRNRNIGVVIGVTLAVAGVAGWGAKYLAVHNPWHDASADGFEISVDPPRITAAKSGTEELAYNPFGGGVKKPSSGARPGGSAANKAGGGPGTHTEADGMELAQVDQSAINAVVKSKERTLYPCLIEESKRNPKLAEAAIPIEFAIGNKGVVSKVWVDLPSYKEGPMVDCLFRELQKWPFKPSESAVGTVALSFHIGKPR